MPTPIRNAERDLRLADFIRDELARALLSDVRDPRIGMTSVTDVRVNRDMSRADVYVSSLSARSESERDALIAALDHAAGFLRSKVAQSGNLRTTPRFRFHYDDLVESGSRIEALIDRAVEGRTDQAAGPLTPPGR